MNHITTMLLYLQGDGKQDIVWLNFLLSILYFKPLQGVYRITLYILNGIDLVKVIQPLNLRPLFDYLTSGIKRNSSLSIMKGTSVRNISYFDSSVQAMVRLIFLIGTYFSGV